MFTMVLGGIAAGQGVVNFEGLDAGLGPGGPLPNSDAAAASFDAAAQLLGDSTVRILDFETVNLGVFLQLSPAETGMAGLSILPAAQSSGVDTAITDQLLPVEEGFNTSVGGSRFLKIEENQPGPGVEPPVGITFDFAVPVVAFGAYFTGADPSVPGALSAVFYNGQIQSVPLGGSPGGGAQFWGFTDSGGGAGVTSVTILASPELGVTTDVVGIDDVRWVYVPEPGAVMLLLCSGFILIRRRR